MAAYPYRMTGPIGTKATIGLIVLQVDETIEHDFRRYFPACDVALYVSRIPSGSELTPETIARMEIDLPQAVSLLPPAAAFDVIGYGCTSGTTLMGAARVAELVTRYATTAAVSDPLTAAIAALRAVGAATVAIVSPYVASVVGPIQQAFESAGIDVAATISFGEEIEARVARIDPQSIRAAAREAAAKRGVDAVFLSCTNLRTFDIINDLESDLALPVISSNQALAWHMARLSGAPLAATPPGRLFSV